jgi:two-component system, cell cycle response regulator
MPNAPRFLDKLVSMTAIQDLELMEFSLLKTLEEFIRAHELFVLKIDRNGLPCYQLNLKQEKYEIIWENIQIPEEIRAGIEIVRSAEKPFVQEIDSTKYLTIWQILQSKSQEVFLATLTKKKLNELDTHMINGLLGIYRNFYEVLSESQRDQLTGLANRKTFDDMINKIYFQRPMTTESVQVERRVDIDDASSCFWLGMVDLDNFKRVNDTWGHLYGDEVLLLTSQLMQRHFRGNDYLFRFGGEEFVIIIRTPNEKSAHRAYERFRLAIEKHPFPQVGTVTISIGFTKMDPSIFTATLLDQADKALYFAKKNGRNQVCFFEKLLRKGLVEETKFVSGEIDLF